MHGFALVCKSVLGYPWALGLLGRCQRIVTAVKSSHLLGGWLSEQTAGFGGPQKLQSSATTRFTSVGDCMQSVQRLEYALVGMVREHQLDFPKQRGKGENIKDIILDRRGFWAPLSKLVPLALAFQKVQGCKWLVYRNC